jgi:hypothetical protein
VWAEVMFYKDFLLLALLWVGLGCGSKEDFRQIKVKQKSVESTTQK